MVNISNNQNQRVSVSTNNNNSVSASSPKANDVNAGTNANAQLARSWAIGEGLIQGIDYSSKYYANQSNLYSVSSNTYSVNANVWAEGTDEEVQALGGTHSSKGWVNYVLTNPPTATVEQTETGALLTVHDINGTTTAELLNGVTPIATVSKSGSTATITITDANGTTSAQISDGQDGIDGQDGAAATISVGTVSTGAAGSSASVVNSGTSSAAVFDFTIPKGDKGETGNTGATGNGVLNTEYISSSGLVDTYHINYTNGTYDSFTVTNGQNGTGSVADVLVNGVSVLDGSVAKVLVPTNNNQLTNGAGYITGITSSDVTTALGYTPLSNATKYGSSLSYSSNVLQLLDQDGNDLGSSVTIQSSPDIDNKSITTNSDDELQTVGVIDQNNTTNAIKTWTGTQAEYDAIVTKDATTLYNITDDSDVTFALLELLFPVGAVYFGTMSVCPLQTLGVGTWQALPQDKVIQIAGTRGGVGDTLNESLPNIKSGTNWRIGVASGQSYSSYHVATATNTVVWVGGTDGVWSGTADVINGVDASLSSSTYQDNAPVQQDAYLLNGWRRIA